MNPKNKKNSKEEQMSCCSTKTAKKPKTLLEGMLYGLIPHIGCIAFIIGSVLGVTVLMQFFKPILMNRYFFHFLMMLSILFATLSSVLYLKRNGYLSLKGAKRKWKYLAAMYGSTIGVNLVLFMVIFPLLANVSVADPLTGSSIGAFRALEGDSLLILKVDIPCPGHAPLISNELKNIEGIVNIKFKFPNNFDVSYDSTKTNKQEILSLDVFKPYPAKILEEISLGEKKTDKDLSSVQQTYQQPKAAGCGCGGY